MKVTISGQPALRISVKDIPENQFFVGVGINSYGKAAWGGQRVLMVMRNGHATRLVSDDGLFHGGTINSDGFVEHYAVVAELEAKL